MVVRYERWIIINNTMKRFGYIVNKGKSLVMGDSYFQGPGYSVTHKLQAAYPENDFEVSILKLQGWEKD